MDERAETGLIGGVEKREIVIAEYDPAWPARFEALAVALRAVLGDTLLRLEHIGSTSVPGLAAKPIIDMDIVLEDWTDYPVVHDRLLEAGYRSLGDLGITGREAFRPPVDGRPSHSLYVGDEGRKALADHRDLRDRLRADPDVALRYAELKRDLAVRHADSRDDYTDAKAPFITEILGRENLP